MGKKDTSKETDQYMTHKTEVTADGTEEKGLGPADALVKAESLYGFQLLTMKILGREEDKANWQDWDHDIKIVKGWLKEGQQPTGTEINFQTSDVQVYRKVISVLKLIPVEGTAKTMESVVRIGCIHYQCKRESHNRSHTILPHVW